MQPWYLWDRRPRARSDDDGLCTDALAAHLQSLLLHEPGLLLEHRDVGSLAVALLDGLGLGVNIVKDAPDDELPVHGLDLGLDAELLRPLDGLHDVGAVDKHLGRDAPSVVAGSTKGPRLGHCYREPPVGGLGGDLQPRAGADDDEIKSWHDAPPGCAPTLSPFAETSYQIEANPTSALP